MRTLLWVVVGLNQLFLLAWSSLRLHIYSVSDFALHEQFGHKTDPYSQARRQLHKVLPQVLLLQGMKIVLGIVLLAALLTYLLPLPLALLYAILGLLLTIVLARLPLIQHFVQRLFEANLTLVLRATEVLQPLWAVIGIPKRPAQYLPSSSAEFTDMLRRLPSTAVTPPQRQRLELLLAADEKTAADVMTHKKRVVTVEPAATLGPVLLSDLQKSAHGYFPVVAKKGEPEGILTLSDLNDIHIAKQRTTVRELMSTHIAWVEEETSLLELAQAFLDEKQYVVLVRNQDGKFSGLITIADLMKHLVGIAPAE